MGSFKKLCSCHKEGFLYTYPIQKFLKMACFPFKYQIIYVHAYTLIQEHSLI